MDITGSIVLYKSNPKYINDIINIFYNTELTVKLYLIDNSPFPDIKTKLNLVQSEYIFTENNLGFGAAHNIVLKNSKKFGKYHIIINPDIILKTNIFSEIYKYMEINSEIGLMMPKVLYPNGEIQFLPKLLPSPLDLFIRNAPFLSFLKDKINEKYEMRYLDHNTFFSPKIISGCFSVVRTELLLKHSLYYDDKFFMYFEDFDLSRRFNNVSKLLYNPQIEVIHEYERGAGKSSKLFFIFLKSMIRYFNKWGWFFDKIRKNQ